LSKTASTAGVSLKVYQGKDLEEATTQFQRDAQVAARDGYYPTNQTWQPGSRQDGVALAGIVVVVACWVIAFLLPSNEVWDPYRGLIGTVNTGFPPALRVVLIVGGTVIGALLTVAAFAMRHPGVLTVTCQRTAPPPVLSSPTPADSRSYAERLAALEELRIRGAITDDESGRRRKAILDEM
jgi:hypothetical protein